LRKHFTHCPVVVDAAGKISSNSKVHLWFAFGRKGGGGGNCVKMPKKSTSSLRLDAREVEVGRSGSSRVEIAEEPTSSSCLNMRKVEVVAAALKLPKNPPPARV
jgi:hypothetical protein